MANNDFDREIDKLTKQAVQEQRQELAEKKVREQEAPLTTEAESTVSPKQNEKKRPFYTVGIIVKLEYEGDSVPTKEQLAEDIGHTIMTWVSQKEFYAISSKEAVPKLVSVDVDVDVR